MNDLARVNAYPGRPVGMVSRPVKDSDINQVKKVATRLKRMKAAHDKGRCWKRCTFHA